MPQLRSPRIWGTLPASGGVGATTLTLHLARIAAKNGLRVLLIETDSRAPLREILNGDPPYWEEYRVGNAIAAEAMPRETSAGFALLTKRSSAEITQDLFAHVIDEASANFDLILIDNPPRILAYMSTLCVAENSLPSLIGLTQISRNYRPRIVIINKYASRVKRKSATIEGFITDAQIIHIPKSSDLHLALGFGITRKLAKINEKKIEALLAEILR